MSEKVLVLITAGRNESVDYVTVREMEKQEAETYCFTGSTGRQKHWRECQIIRLNQTIEVGQPENDNGCG